MHGADGEAFGEGRHWAASLAKLYGNSLASSRTVGEGVLQYPSSSVPSVLDNDGEITSEIDRAVGEGVPLYPSLWSLAGPKPLGP